jgi:hypothetical protein
VPKCAGIRSEWARGDLEVREGCRGGQRREIRDARTKEVDPFQPLEPGEPGDAWERVVAPDNDGDERVHGTQGVEVLEPRRDEDRAEIGEMSVERIEVDVGNRLWSRHS